jgi:hypothetical protein
MTAFGRMGEVEFDWPAATGLEVDEQRPVLRVEHVSRMRLAVQKLLGDAEFGDSSSEPAQRAGEKLSVQVGERRRLVARRDQLLRVFDSSREVGRGDSELAHASMQPFERVRVVGWFNLAGRHGRVVGPQGDDEAVTLVGARRRSRLKRSHRAAGLAEPLGKLDLEQRGVLRLRCDSGEDVTRQQADGEVVRVLKNDRVVDRQAKRRDDRRGRRHRTRDIGRLHEKAPSAPAQARVTTGPRVACHSPRRPDITVGFGT